MDGFVDTNLYVRQYIADDADLESRVGLHFLEREDIVPTHSKSGTVIYKTLNCLSYRKPFAFPLQTHDLEQVVSRSLERSFNWY